LSRSRLNRPIAGSNSRGRQGDALPFGREDVDQPADDRRLPNARSAGNDEHFVPRGRLDRFPLRGGEFQAHLPLHPFQRLFDLDLRQRVIALRKRANGPGDADLRQEHRLEVEPLLLGRVRRRGGAPVPNQLVLLPAGLDRLSNHIGGDVRQPHRLIDHAVLRVSDVPLRAHVLEDVADRGPGPQGRVLGQPEPRGQLVGGLEPDAPDVRRQPVRVALHQVDRRVAVLLVDAHRPGRPDPVRLQEHHDRPDALLFLPRLADPLQPLRADPLHLR
jgi:hypothetical protein